MAAVRVCKAAGATPVFCHHITLTATRAKGQSREPMGLADLAHAGIAQAARQWCLLSYQTPYDPATGRCAMWMNAGGSSGQGGLYLLHLDQGSSDENLAGVPFRGGDRDSNRGRRCATVEFPGMTASGNWWIRVLRVWIGVGNGLGWKGNTTTHSSCYTMAEITTSVGPDRSTGTALGQSLAEGREG